MKPNISKLTKFGGLVALIMVVLMATSVSAREDFTKPAEGNLLPELPGSEQVITTEAGGLIAFDQNGAILPNFPIELTDKVVASSPALINLTGDQQPEIVVVTRDNNSDYALTVFDASANQVTEAAIANAVYYDPRSIHLGANQYRGVLLATEAGTIDIFRMESDNLISQRIDAIGSPAGISVSSSGWKLAANIPTQNQLRVYRYTDTEWVTGETISTPASIPYPVTFAPNNRMYAVDTANQLTAFNESDGAVTPGFPVALPGQPIAEPELVDLINENPGPELLVQLADGRQFFYGLDGAPLGKRFAARSINSQSRAAINLNKAGALLAVPNLGARTITATDETLSTIYGAIRRQFTAAGFSEAITHPLVANANTMVNLAWADYNNDQNVDVLLGSTEAGRLFAGNPLSEVNSLPSDLTDGGGPINWVDIDNDNDLDAVLIASGNANHLFTNNSGTFAASTLSTTNESNLHTAWLDYNADGYTDLFLANSGANELLINNQGVLETAVDSGINLGNKFTTFAIPADIDNDGDQDLFVGNYGSTNELYQNDGGQFTALANVVTTSVAGNSFNGVWDDFNNDGLLDLFVLNYEGANELYLNNGGGEFTAVSSTPIVDDPSLSFVVTTGDYDNDADIDIYIGNYGTANQIYQNQGDGTFTPLANELINGTTEQTVAGGFVDYDEDGHLDLVLGGAQQNNLVYHNESTDANWHGIKLTSATGNQYPNGAQVKLTMNDGSTQTRHFQLTPTKSTQVLNYLHFGTGSKTVSSATVLWPTGTVQDITNLLQPGQVVEITEEATPQPDIAISLNGQPFSNGGQVALMAAENSEKVFAGTIQNTGDQPLILPADPITITGDSASKWTITQPASLTIEPAGETSFELTYQATDKGEETIQFAIASNDPNEGDFQTRIVTTTSGTTISSVTTSTNSVAADGIEEITFTVTVSGNPDTINEARFICNHPWHTENERLCYLIWDADTDEFTVFIDSDYSEFVSGSSQTRSGEIEFTFTLKFSNVATDIIDNILASIVYQEGGGTSWVAAPEEAYFDIIADAESLTEPQLESVTVNPAAITAGNEEAVEVVVRIAAPDPEKQDQLLLHVNHEWHSEGRPRYGLFQYDNGSFAELGSPTIYNNDKLELLETSERTVDGNTVEYRFQIQYDELPEGYETDGLADNVVSILYQTREDGESTYNSGWQKQDVSFTVNPQN